jgi:hypothetical protein
VRNDVKLIATTPAAAMYFLLKVFIIILWIEVNWISIESLEE